MSAKNLASAIIVAAGASTRMRIEGSKTLLTLLDAPVLAHTLRAFQNAATVAEIVVVARPEDMDAVFEVKEIYGVTKLRAVARGGATRARSVQNGIAKISPDAKWSAIHDGARCLITSEGVDTVINAAFRYHAASAATPVTDTVKTATKRGYIASTLDRDTVFTVQTPQVFEAELYFAALATVKEKDNLTDDNQLMEKIGCPVRLVDIGRENIKITHPEDLALAEFILKKRSNSL